MTQPQLETRTLLAQTKTTNSIALTNECETFPSSFFLLRDDDAFSFFVRTLTKPASYLTEGQDRQMKHKEFAFDRKAGFRPFATNSGKLSRGWLYLGMNGPWRILSNCFVSLVTYVRHSNLSIHDRCFMAR